LNHWVYPKYNFSKSLEEQRNTFLPVIEYGNISVSD